MVVMAERVALSVFAFGFVLLAIFSYPLANQIVHYQSYTSYVTPDSLNWTSLAVHDELWRPVAHFEYTVDGKKYEGKEVFQGGLYRTPYAAEVAIKTINNSHPVVWYSPYAPDQASIEKFFPLKKLIYALITLFLIGYAAWAAYYLGIMSKFSKRG